MAEAQDELWRDVSIVVKHSRLILALLVVALIAAIASGLLTNTTHRARSEAEIQLETAIPLSGNTEATPDLETYEKLAMSDDVAAAAASKVGLSAEELRGKITVTTIVRNIRDPASLDRLAISATGDTQAQAEATAAATMDAFAEAARALQSDPEGLESLRQQEALALEDLGKYDQQQVIELGKVQADLGATRALTSALSQDITSIEQALELLQTQGSRPLGELIVAVAGMLGGPEGSGGIEQASTVEELRGGLTLRNGLAQELKEKAETKVAALALLEQDLLAATTGQRSALAVYNSAVRNVQAAILAGTQTRTEVSVTASAVDTSTGADWPARLGAAAAFALVTGVAGAFALEFVTSLSRRRRQRSEKTRPEEA
ncbi:MAG TPA: hypothetical protein VI789_04675 [Dehalococcoidia bacterium]|nr:hypothetical protein [Dehalococcoidia bacterium]